MKTFKADLHIHSCLSPCAELDMTPIAIVEKAVEMNLDILAVSDHNSAEHVDVVSRIGRRHGIVVLPAMELCSSEEVHVLALFGEIESCIRLQEEIYSHIPPIPSYRHDETFQPVVNEINEILFFNSYPLINATDIPIASLVSLIHERGGIAIASHIEREAFSIISQLGFIPDDLPLDAVEISWRVRNYSEVVHLIPPGRYTAVSFSDAHHLTDIGRRITEFRMKDATLEEIRMCLKGEAGRSSGILY